MHFDFIFLDKEVTDICDKLSLDAFDSKLLEIPLINTLCQAVDDTKLLAHLREDATIFWTSETWKDLATSWEVVATRLCEILAATHKSVKIK